MTRFTALHRMPAVFNAMTFFSSRLDSRARKTTKLHLEVAATLVAVMTLTGCAAGSALVTGEVRPAIEDHTSVSIVTEVPDGSELIAIVKASSDAGWTQQHSLNYAVDELKKQAAKVGANVVVLGDRETSTQTLGLPSDDGGTFVSSTEVEIVQGMAVWVD